MNLSDNDRVQELIAERANVAAIATDWVLYVPPCSTVPVASRSMYRRRPTSAATGNPFAMALPSTVRSGSTPSSPCAPPGPTRNPVITSSKISTVPVSSQSSRTAAR